MTNLIVPRTTRMSRTSRWRSVALLSSEMGMKSTTSPTPSSVRNRVIRMAVPGQVHLLRHVAFVGRPDPEVSALVRVEQRREDARRVEARGAEPVDRAVGADQRRRLKVADQPVIADVGIPFHACSSR